MQIADELFQLSIYLAARERRSQPQLYVNRTQN